tara:strand:+ start:332 stop:508 length:177 start_codon:yes stop_codon:yes gene_type:complete
MKNKNKGENKMKNLNIIDLIALATNKPELFKDKKQLALILDVKEKLVKDLYKQYKERA